MTEHKRQTLEEMEEEFLNRLPIERRLRGLSLEECLLGLSAEERLRALSAEGRLRGLSDDEIERAFADWKARTAANELVSPDFEVSRIKG